MTRFRIEVADIENPWATRYFINGYKVSPGEWKREVYAQAVIEELVVVRRGSGGQTRPTIHGLDVGPLRNYFLSQLAVPPKHGQENEIANEYARKP